MKVRKQRRLSRVVVLGLATAAVGAGSAQATAIPYLSHGQGISEEQLAQLQNTTPSAASKYMASGWGEYVAQARAQSSSSPSIAVGGHYLDSNLQTGNRAAPSTDVGGPATGAYGNPVGSSPAVGVTSDSPVRPDDRANHGPLNIPVEEPSSTASPGDGLNWGDFSAGVGSALGLVLVAGAALFTLRRSRKTQLAGS
jgi:hypothetical protein